MSLAFDFTRFTLGENTVRKLWVSKTARSRRSWGSADGVPSSEAPRENATPLERPGRPQPPSAVNAMSCATPSSPDRVKPATPATTKRKTSGDARRKARQRSTEHRSMVLLQLGLPATQLSTVSAEQRNTGHAPAQRTPVLRVPQSLRHSRVTQARLHELIVAKLYESPPSTEAEVQQLMAKDARLTRALVWQSRHVLAFGPRMHRSVAARLLHTYTHPGCEQVREAWL